MIFNSKKRKTRRVIRETAVQHGISKTECRSEMQAALDEAWENALRDPAVKTVWERYFQAGKKPTLEEFISRLGEELHERL